MVRQHSSCASRGCTPQLQSRKSLMANATSSCGGDYDLLRESPLHKHPVWSAVATIGLREEGAPFTQTAKHRVTGETVSTKVGEMMISCEGHPLTPSPPAVHSKGMGCCSQRQLREKHM